MKKTKGIIAQIEEAGNVATYKPSNITLDDLYRFNTAIDVAEPRPIFLSLDQNSYMEAVMLNHEEKMLYFEHKFWKEAAVRRLEEYKKIKEQESFLNYQLILLFDRKFSRDSAGLWFKKAWQLNDIELTHDYWEDSNPSIVFFKGKFSIIALLYDETGYDHKEYVIAKDLSGVGLLNELNKLKSHKISLS